MHAKQGVRAQDRDDTAKVVHHVEAPQRGDPAQRLLSEAVGNLEDLRRSEKRQRVMKEFEFRTRSGSSQAMPIKRGCPPVISSTL